VRYARQNEQLQRAEGGRVQYLVRLFISGKYAMLSEPKLYPAHVCKACGQEVLRLEMDAPTLVSGVVECPACGSSGALNIEIRSLEDRKPPVRSNGKR
jgi:DNA-directed RNA polymerase subunit RPC12/RpoP